MGPGSLEDTDRKRARGDAEAGGESTGGGGSISRSQARDCETVQLMGGEGVGGGSRSGSGGLGVMEDVEGNGGEGPAGATEPGARVGGCPPLAFPAYETPFYSTPRTSGGSIVDMLVV